MTQNNISREIEELYELLNCGNSSDVDNNFKLRNCNNEEVLAFDNKLLKANELRDLLISVLIEETYISIVQNTLKQNYGIKILPSILFNEGIDCEILKLGAQSWQKGKFKIKVSLEFCPDELFVEEKMASKDTEINQAESPLDDIRRMIAKDN